MPPKKRIYSTALSKQIHPPTQSFTIFTLDKVAKEKGRELHLVDAHSRSPSRRLFLVVTANVDLVWEWVRLGRRDGRDVVLVSVGEGDGFHDGVLQRRLGGFADFSALCIWIISKLKTGRRHQRVEE
jgi:hypothetical protein